MPIKPKKLSSELQNIKGKGLETQSFAQQDIPGPVKTASKKTETAPRAKRIMARTEKKVSRKSSNIDKSISKSLTKASKLSARSEKVAAKGNYKKANLLESRSKFKKLDAGVMEKTKAGTLNAITKQGTAKAKAAQKRANDRATLKVARKTGNVSPRAKEIRRGRKIAAGIGAVYGASVGAMIAAGKKNK